MVLVNGVFTDSVKANDRGLMYGDGIFRTLCIKNGIPQHWERHYLKLSRDCAVIGIVCPALERLTLELDLVAQENPDCVAKITITRGEGGRGYLPDADLEPTRIILTSPLQNSANFREIRAHLCNFRLSHQPELAGIKHLNRLENVLARREWRQADVPEGVLLDIDGNVIEGTMSSIFLYKDASLIAPDLSRCGVDGVQRERIFEFSSACGVPTEIRTFGIDFLKQADEVFLVNSVIGLWQIVEIDGMIWQKGKFCDDLRNWLQ